MNNTEMVPITKIVGYKFEGQPVTLDFHQFDNCEFKRCRLVYFGYAPVGLSHCVFTECEWELAGPAGNTVTFLRSMYEHGGGFESFVDELFNAIKKGQ